MKGDDVTRRSTTGSFEVSFAGVLLLGIATMIASAVVFLLGIYVGKGIAEQRFEAEQTIVRLPASPLATPRESTDVTFYDRLERSPAAGAAPAATPTEAAEEPLRVEPPAGARAEPTNAPAPVAEPTEAPVVAGVDAFKVQVAAMSDRKRADSIVRDLSRKGYTATVSPAVIGGKTLYRVRVVGLATEEAARQAMGRLRAEGYPEARLAAE